MPTKAPPKKKHRQKELLPIAYERVNPYTDALVTPIAMLQQYADDARSSIKSHYCHRCMAPMIWAQNWKTGKAIPLDKEPNPAGPIVFVGYGQIHYLHRNEQQPGGNHVPHFTSHFQTCPFAQEFRS